MNSVDTTLDMLDRTQRVTNHRILHLDRKIESHHESNNALKKHLQEQAKTLSKISKSLTKIDNKLSSQDVKIKRMNQKIISLEERAQQASLKDQFSVVAEEDGKIFASNRDSDDCENLLNNLNSQVRCISPGKILF